MIASKDDDGKAVLVCATHNQLRLQRPPVTKIKAPTVTAPKSIMSEKMRLALEAPASPAHNTVKVSEATAAIDANAQRAAAERAALAAAAEATAGAVHAPREPAPVPVPPAVPAAAAAAAAAPPAAPAAVPAAKREITHSMAHLVDNLEGGDENTQLRTFWEISNIAKDSKGLHELANPQLGLLAMMAKIIREDSGESRSAAIGVLWNLSVALENRLTIIDPAIGLLGALTNVLHLIVHRTTDETECVHRTLGVLHNITLSAEAQQGVGAYLPIYDALAKALRSHDAIITDRAAGILWNLATCAANRSIMVDHSGLLVAVTQVLNAPVVSNASDEADNTDPGSKALIVIYYCTLATEARASMGAVDGLLAALLLHFKTGSAEARLKVIGVFAHLSSAAENKGPLADPNVGLLPELVLALKDTSSEAELRSKVCGCLWNLSVASSNRALLADSELGLVSVLVDLLNACTYSGGKAGASEGEEAQKEEIATRCCIIIQNLAGERTCHDNLLALPAGQTAGGLVGALVRTVLQSKGDARLKAFGALVNLSLTDAAQAVLGKDPLMFTALKSILQDPEVGEHRARACGVLQNLSINVENRLLIALESGLLDLLVSLLKDGPSGQKLVMSVLGLLLNLSVAVENKPLIGGAVGACDACIRLIDSGTDDEKVKAISLVWSLANNAENKASFSTNGTLVAALTNAAGQPGDIKVKAMGALNYLAPNVKV